MKIVVFDAATNKIKPSTKDESEVGGASTSAKGSFLVVAESFTDVPAGFDIESGDDLDVWLNGRLADEGAGNDYTFNYVGDLVVWEYGLHENDKIKIRRY